MYCTIPFATEANLTNCNRFFCNKNIVLAHTIIKEGEVEEKVVVIIIVTVTILMVNWSSTYKYIRGRESTENRIIYWKF